MKPWALWLGLFLSLGFNFGLLASRLAPTHLEATPAAPTPGPPADTATDTDTTTAVDDAPGRVPPRLERMVVRLADDLGLQGAKRRRFFDLEREFFARTVRARLQQRRLEGEVRRLLLGGEAERGEVEKVLDDMVEAQRQVEQAFLDNYFAARDLLDPQQMHRYQRFLGQLRRATEELSRQARPGIRPR